MRYIECFRDVYCPYCGADVNDELSGNEETEDGYCEDFRCSCGARFYIQIFVERPAEDRYIDCCRKKFVEYWNEVGFKVKEVDAFEEIVDRDLVRHTNDEDNSLA